MPRKCLKNWHEFVGNTNVIDVTEKSGTGTASLGAETGGQAMEKIPPATLQINQYIQLLS
jgi:hypothetical protein